MDNLSTKLFRAQEHLNDQESFSFSSFDFNSPLGIFSDEDEDDDHENDDEAYIEITLEQEQEQQTVPPNSSTRLKENDHGVDLELLRVSFSSSVCSFPGFSCSSTTDSTSACSSLITANQSQKKTGVVDTVLCINPKSNGGKTGFTSLNRLVDVLLSTLKLKRSSSSSALAVLLGNSNGCDLGGGRQHEKKGSWELVRTRKATSKVNGGARKLLIKFRSINILSMVASFVKPKPRQVIASSTINSNIRTTSQEESFSLRNHSRSNNSQRNINKHLEGIKSAPKLRRRNNVENSRFLEINLDSITKMVEAVSKNIVGTRGKSKQSKSCPGSIKSSPIHQARGLVASSDSKIYARENSVQAAIAHCKQSFGQNR